MLNDNIGEVIQIQKTLINNEKMKFRYLKKKTYKNKLHNNQYYNIIDSQTQIYKQNISRK